MCSFGSVLSVLVVMCDQSSIKLAKKRLLRTRCQHLFHAQNVPCNLLEIADQSDVVLNSGLGERAVITGEECPRLRFGVRRHNQPLRMCIPNSGLEILYLPIPYAVDGSAHTLVLCAHFGPDA